MKFNFLYYLIKKISNSIAFSLGLVLTLSIVYAATTWVSGQIPQAAPTDGNIASPVFIDGPMLGGLGCITTGDGNGIKCDTALRAAVDLVITTDTFDYNIATEAGNPVDPVDVTLTINTGIIVGSTSTSNAALSTGDLPAGSTVKIVNNGRIQGKGGDGGITAQHTAAAAGGTDGERGGDALELIVPIELVNSNGQIWSGGGGGGGAGVCHSWYHPCWWAAGGGSGGGAGSVPGSSYLGGADGSTESGGSGAPNPQNSRQCWGGRGGDPGLPGTDAYTSSGNTCAGQHNGGLAGDAIQKNGNVITWIGTQGDIKGQIN